MKFTLKAYHDLGRCSYGTLMDEFDTEKDEIYDNDKKVKVRTVEDLFPYLWQSAGVAVHNNGKSKSYFHGAGTHWHWDFDESIKDHEKDAIKFEKKARTAPTIEKRRKYEEEAKYERDHNESLKTMLARLDAEMEEQKIALIEENRK